LKALTIKNFESLNFSKALRIHLCIDLLLYNIFCYRRRFVTETFCYRRRFVMETFCRGDVLLRRRFVRRRFVEEMFCKETFCMCVEIISHIWPFWLVPLLWGYRSPQFWLAVCGSLWPIGDNAPPERWSWENLGTRWGFCCTTVAGGRGRKSWIFISTWVTYDLPGSHPQELARNMVKHNLVF
jgi:hypothetical protein